MSRTIQVGLNRVEGDLEIKLEVAGNRIVDAWTSGTMYRGFEQILIGRSALDGLVITPRICGICGTAHQYAAVTALETAFNCAVAPNGTRVRNICLLAEEVQSDPKHVFLLFTPDLFNPKYRDEPWFAEALAYFEPLKGWVYKEVVKMTKTILEIVAIFGGQWPHSSYMLPGGVVTPPNPRKILESMAILDNYQRWYEKTILGCSSERWLAIKTLADLDVWLAERKEHHDSPAGLYIRVLRAIGLTELGRGKGNLLSFGVYNDPVTWQPPFTQHRHLRPSGFYSSATGKIAAFDHQAVTEHVKHSWYLDYEGGRHPWEGQTIPDYQVPSEKYSWAKAPRYQDQVVEVGPIAELFMAGDPLTTDVFVTAGTTAWTRQFIRIHRPVLSLQLLRQQLQELIANAGEPYYIQPASTSDGTGYGLLHAARGCLGHWVKIADGKIARYQVITPTAWNASPRDGRDMRGHWEETFIGTEIADLDNPVEVGHIVRSHDACLVCTVHMLQTGERLVYRV